ncbi:hypothetical protein SLS53_002267 [Cytospora paraplurivora]|uniref:Glutamine synthetase n=1 Tax=Cytospora paraplurivora TaxID=2898453 RepID=A0AAN9UEN9_9PEZI
MPSWTSSSGATGVTRSQLDEVARAIQKCPIIDNHAHPLLKPEALAKHPLLSITTEASGDAIHAASTSLSHLRGIKQLAHVLDCAQTWEAVVAAIEQRRIEDYDDWISECLDGIETILIDDGLDDVDDVYNYARHDAFTRSPCKRIVRIETVAGWIVHRVAVASSDDDNLDEIFETVLEEFDTSIRNAIADPEVAGFKSVICYRTGLDISASVDIALARTSFKEIITSYAGKDSIRIQHPGLNDLLVHRTAQLISETPGRQKKPLQFHTGLGDNDITLTKSSPAHLQDFIRAHPIVPIVLLHASYPFTRELGYLATVYANVYAVLCDYVRRGAVSWKGAIELARDVLFNNSNRLYHLELQFSEWGEDEYGEFEPEGEETDLELFTRFLRGKAVPDFIRISWTDLTAMPRMRMIPFRKLMSLLEGGKPLDIGITKAALGILQHDSLAPGFTASGEYRLHPDFSSLKSGPIPGHFGMQGDFRERDGSWVPLCPRTQLSRAQELGAREGLSFLVGFEIEFVLLQRHSTGSYGDLTNDGHSWSVSRFFADPKIPKLLADIVKSLESMDIFVEQIHAESAPGQFELVLPPLPPVQAVDTLLHTREVIAALATAAGYKFTLYPKPFPHACGTAAHAHISISSSGGEKKVVYEPFYAGVLKHLRAITAFTYSNPASHERLVDGAWAGGSGIPGWNKRGEKLIWQDCEVDPANLTENDRKELNVTEMLPASVEEALQALKEDKELTELLNSELVEKYTAVKQYELKVLSNMNEENRRQWIIARY